MEKWILQSILKIKNCKTWQLKLVQTVHVVIFGPLVKFSSPSFYYTVSDIENLQMKKCIDWIVIAWLYSKDRGVKINRTLHILQVCQHNHVYADKEQCSKLQAASLSVCVDMKTIDIFILTKKNHWLLQSTKKNPIFVRFTNFLG